MRNRNKLLAKTSRQYFNKLNRLDYVYDQGTDEELDKAFIESETYFRVTFLGRMEFKSRFFGTKRTY